MLTEVVGHIDASCCRAALKPWRRMRNRRLDLESVRKSEMAHPVVSMAVVASSMSCESFIVACLCVVSAWMVWKKPQRRARRDSEPERHGHA